MIYGLIYTAFATTLGMVAIGAPLPQWLDGVAFMALGLLYLLAAIHLVNAAS